MAELTRDMVLEALGRVRGPDLDRSIVEMKMVSDIFISDGKVYFSINVPAERAEELEPLRQAAERTVKALPGVKGAVVSLTAERKLGSAPPPPRPQAGAPAHSHGHSHAPAAPTPSGTQRSKTGVPGIDAIIAVASGKGGVGKSTTAVNLALALKANGLRVGILDADVYGPSMPRLLGITGRPQQIENRIIVPMENFGIKVMSMGFLVDEGTAMIWRGPMVQSALMQMLREVAWGDLDVLVVDMPPGTGDAQLTMAQQVPLSGAVIVSTPQDLALIDARKGVLTQTRRHSYLAHLVGIPHIVVAVNKMDLVNYDQAAYEKIKADYLAFAEQIGLQRAGHDITFIPLSALNGDMIVDRGEGMDWYTGPTLIDLLEAVPAAHSEQSEDFRFPVQFVCRPHASDDPELHDFRGFMGKVESGEIAVGDAVTALPSGQSSKVKAIQLGSEQLPEAITEQSVTLLLEDEIDISRGDMIVKTGGAPEPVKQIEAFVCWLSETPLSAARTYIIRHTTRESKAKVGEISYKVDVNTLEQLPSQGLAMNDIARISFRLAQPLMVDAYSRNRATGAFIVIDESTNNTVGAGMITG